MDVESKTNLPTRLEKGRWIWGLWVCRTSPPTHVCTTVVVGRGCPCRCMPTGLGQEALAGWVSFAVAVLSHVQAFRMWLAGRDLSWTSPSPASPVVVVRIGHAFGRVSCFRSVSCYRTPYTVPLNGSRKINFRVWWGLRQQPVCRAVVVPPFAVGRSWGGGPQCALGSRYNDSLIAFTSMVHGTSWC